MELWAARRAESDASEAALRDLEQQVRAWPIRMRHVVWASADPGEVWELVEVRREFSR